MILRVLTVNGTSFCQWFAPSVFGMISERIQLHRYKSLYEELYNFIEREIETMP